MTQTIIASVILVVALLYIGGSVLKAIRPKKKKGCGCCGCGDKAKKPVEDVISINR